MYEGDVRDRTMGGSGPAVSALRIRNALIAPLGVQFSHWQLGFTLLPAAEFVIRQRLPRHGYFEVDRAEAHDDLADLFVHGWHTGEGTVTIGTETITPPPPPWIERVADQNRRWPEPRSTADELGVLLSDGRSPSPRLLSAVGTIASGPSMWLTAVPAVGGVVTLAVHSDHFTVLDVTEARATSGPPG